MQGPGGLVGDPNPPCFRPSFDVFPSQLPRLLGPEPATEPLWIVIVARTTALPSARTVRIGSRFGWPTPSARAKAGIIG